MNPNREHIDDGATVEVNAVAEFKAWLTGPPSLCRRSPIGRRCTPGAARSLPCSLDADDVHDEICRIWWLPGTCGPSIGLRAKAGPTVRPTGCER